MAAWLLPYRNKNNIQFHLENLTKRLALYSTNYGNPVILGDFNTSTDSSYFAGCNTYDLGNVITQPTCYKNPENPSCIDLILINHPHSFQILLYFRQAYLTFIK